MAGKLRNSWRRAYWLVWLIVAALPAAAQTGGPDPNGVQTGSLLMKTADGFMPAPLVNTDVNIVINGLVARVSVMQEFTNDGADWAEGIYAFPLPDRAAVDHMRLYIGDRFIEGEVQEKRQARETYARAREEGRKTSLVEQQRANLFTTSVANIGPGESVIVEIEYLEDVRYDDGTWSLRFPMTLTPRYQPGQPDVVQPGAIAMPAAEPESDAYALSPPLVAASGGQRASIRALVNAGLPLEIIASRYHPVNVSQAVGHYVVTLASPRVPMDHDFELVWRAVPSDAARALAFRETVDGRPHFLLMVVPPDAGHVPASVLPREMIFIVDTSGSMHGVSLEQARAALMRALDTLQPADRFNVIEFNSTSTPLFAGSVAADAVNVGNAKNFVRQLQANGGTEMYPALDFALRTPPATSHLRQIVFITDGAVANEEGLFALIEDRLDDARLFTVGIGSAPNSWFMRKAAETGRGAFTTISALHEVGERMDRLFEKLEYPQVTDITVDWPSGTVVDSYPAIVPDVYLGEPVTVRARAATAMRPGDRVRVSGNSVAGAWVSEISLAGDVESPGVAALWARARIADLMDAARRGADPETTRAAVVETALAHHLVSRYTSLVAVDKTPARPSGYALAGGRVPNLLARGQGGAVAGFPATATDAPGMRLAGMLTLLLAAALMGVTALRRSLQHGRAA